jgi:hypothetical protein
VRTLPAHFALFERVGDARTFALSSVARGDVRRDGGAATGRREDSQRHEKRKPEITHERRSLVRLASQRRIVGKEDGEVRRFLRSFFSPATEAMAPSESGGAHWTCNVPSQGPGPLNWSRSLPQVMVVAPMATSRLQDPSTDSFSTSCGVVSLENVAFAKQ